MTVAKPIAKRARRIAVETGRNEEEVKSELSGFYVEHLHARGVAGMWLFGTLGFSLLAVLVFVPSATADEQRIKNAVLLGIMAVLGNLALGAGAVYLKKRMGHWWGIVEVAGGLLAGISMVVQVIFAAKTDYGVWLLAELAAIFGIVKGVDTFEKGTVQEVKSE